MRTLKTLLMLGAAVAGGLYLASPRARDARKRLRGAYEILTHAAASPAPHVGVDAPRAEPSTSLDAGGR